MRRQSDTQQVAVQRVRCAIYTRKSTDENLDAEFNSLDAQRESAEAYVASQRHEGWVALPVRYDDGGFSGGNLERPGLQRLLDDVEAAMAGDGEAALVQPGGPLGPAWEWLPQAAHRSKTGLVLVRTGGAMLAVAPPFPLDRPGGGGSAAGPLDVLRELLVRKRLVAVVLLRLGPYAVGVVHDGTPVLSKTGTRYVPARQRAGGQSQRRFERGRETWIRQLYDEVCEVCRSRLGPYADDLHHLAVGGDRHVLEAFLERCAWMAPLVPRVLPARVPVQRPGLAALRRAGRAIWSSRVYVRHLPA